MHCSFISTSLALFAMSLLAKTTLADFHIDNIGTNDYTGATYQEFVACASDNWNCECFDYNDGTGYLDGSPYDSSFSLQAGFCGQPRLDGYNDGNGGFNMYVSGGDGTQVASCYSNYETKECGGFMVHAGIYDGEGWVCLSSICD